MDSMRSLNTSLPSTASSRRRERRQASEAILQAFKQAALSVTNLYKISAKEQTEVYQEGYQDALEDLLSFMDRENIGLQDGEGWRVRQWGTERWQSPGAHSDSGDDVDEEEQRPRSSSPIVQRKRSSDTLRTVQLQSTVIPDSSPVRSESPSPPIALAHPGTTPREPVAASVHVPQSDFSFRSIHQLPSVRDIEMEHSDEQGSGNVSTPLQVNVKTRPSRNARHNSHNPRANSRSSNTIQLGPGAGTKRRNQMLDFFDISNLNGKDGYGGGGGGKRSKHSSGS